MNMKKSLSTDSPAMLIRVHLTDGSIQSFAQGDAATAEKIWKTVDPKRLFAHERLVIAATHSKSVFVCAEIVRIDFIQESYTNWEFPEGYSDVVELSEADFRKYAHLDHPELMPKRTEPTPAGNLLVSFVKLLFKSSPPIFLMSEFSVKLPVE